MIFSLATTPFPSLILYLSQPIYLFSDVDQSSNFSKPTTLGAGSSPPASNPQVMQIKPIWESPPRNSRFPPIKTFRLTKQLVQLRVKDNVIIVTFGNYAFMDFILSWVKHLTDLGLSNLLVGMFCYQTIFSFSHFSTVNSRVKNKTRLLPWIFFSTLLIGAMDTKLLEALYWKGVPVFDMGSHMSTADVGWGSPTFHKMGREKVILIDAILPYGVELLMCDTDMVWLKVLLHDCFFLGWM